MKLFITFSLLCTLFSCNTQSFVTEYLNLNNIPLRHIEADTFPITEIQNPASMYEFNQWIIFPHSASTGEKPLYVYRKDDLKMVFKGGQFGRGPHEIYNCNFYYFEKTDSSFFSNTDYIYETEFTFHNDSIHMGKKELIAPFPLNNLIKINDSVFFFENRLEKNEYSLYNRNSQDIIKKFSNYPLSKQTYKTVDNRDNLCLKSCITNAKKSVICSFYENLPLIRSYDTEGNMLKEIRLKNVPSHIDIKDYENHKSILYYSYPYPTKDYIYVQFINRPLNEYQHNLQTEIQQWNWDLTLNKRFLIDTYFDIFCVDGKTHTLFGVNKKDENSYFIKVSLE